MNVNSLKSVLHTFRDEAIKDQLNFTTLQSKYGYLGIDVRKTFAHLPFQWFWNWVSGKTLPNNKPRLAEQTWLKGWQVLLQLGWSWGLIFLSILAASQTGSFIIKCLALILVTNRTRALLHTFHYTRHGALMNNKRIAQFIAKYFISIPILHTAWEEYKTIHVRKHHHYQVLCTNLDPDQQFMICHGFKPRMTQKEFWYCVLVKPFLPKHIGQYIYGRIKQNYVTPPLSERLMRGLFMAVLLSMSLYYGCLSTVLIYYLFPLLVLNQFSSYYQHITEHLWFPPKFKKINPFIYYASLTWGRFLGRPYPNRKDYSLLTYVAHCAYWFLKVLVIDVPTRVLFMMQDLSSHDFHHREPKMNFWAISQERSNSEHKPSQWGPMTETWSLGESIKILRDHLVKGQSDPFGLYKLIKCKR